MKAPQRYATRMNLSNLFEKFELLSRPDADNLNYLVYRVRVWIEGSQVLSPYWRIPLGEAPYDNPKAVEMLRNWYDRDVAPRLPKPLNEVLRADYSKPLPSPRPFLMLGKPTVIKMNDKLYASLDPQIVAPATPPPKPAPPKEPRSRKFDFSI